MVTDMSSDTPPQNQSKHTSGTVPPTPAPTHSHSAHGEKPAKFTGFDFKRWQQKMLFYLTTLNVQKFLKDDPPAIADEAWEHGNFLCRNYILNGLDDSLYSVYCLVETAKELWVLLEKKYKIEDAGAKKFIVGKFLDFKMIDSKRVITQVEEIQLILHDLVSEGMILNESFKVAAIIEKLPPGWTDFKNYLKHKRKEMGVEDLIVRLQIEENNRFQEAKSKGKEAKVHIAESSTSKKRKAFGNGKQGPSKKFKGDCYNCGQPGHRAKDCRLPKKGDQKGNKRANLVETDDMDFTAVVFEANIAKLDDNLKE